MRVGLEDAVEDVESGAREALRWIPIVGTIVMKFENRNDRLDSLTGLPGRADCDRMLKKAIRRYRRDPSKYFSFIHCDPAGLHHTNVTYGHGAGDNLITTAAGTAKAAAKIRIRIGSLEGVFQQGGDDTNVIYCGTKEYVEKRTEEFIDDVRKREKEINARRILPVPFYMGIGTVVADFIETLPNWKSMKSKKIIEEVHTEAGKLADYDKAKGIYRTNSEMARNHYGKVEPHR